MCNRDCFNCVYEDCICDKVTDDERAEQNLFDKKCRRERPKEERIAKTRKQIHYDYYHSDKGKEAIKRRDKKIVENGKNAIKCKSYYERKGREAYLKKMESEEFKEKKRKYALDYYYKRKMLLENH